MDLIPPLEGRPLWNLRPDAIRQHSREPSRRKGSDLNDMHLLCLASYAAVTYVDKRTMENVMRIPLMADSDSIPIADSVPGDGGHVARVS